MFPGSNCDHDAHYVVTRNLGHQADFVWHDSENLNGFDAIILPGGFSYGDHLRCGAIARFSPVMRAVKKFADAGGLVAGFCNGFQILTEAHILPGALIRNKGLRYICKTVGLETVSANSPFTNALTPGAVLQIPIAHGEGCYTADEATLDQLAAEDRILFRYTDNPNGSMREIAGILSAGRNVMGMMPHPERVSDPLMPGTDGLGVFQSMLNSLAAISR